MINTKTNTITDIILSELQRGPKRIVSLIENIQEKRPKTTKQGVYAAIRILKKEEKIILHKKRISLNSAWIAKMNSFFSVAQTFSNGKHTDDGNFLALKNEEKISYSFKDPVTTDAFWGHAFRLLTETLTPKSPVFVYNPHQFFLLARKEQEESLINYIIKNNCYYFLTVGSNTPLDKTISNFFEGTNKQYHMSPKNLFKKNTYYVNVFNDFIIEVWIGKNTADRIEKLYTTTKSCTENTIQELQNIMQIQEKIKITISRNKRKADNIKKTLSKFFYIPK